MVICINNHKYQCGRYGRCEVAIVDGLFCGDLPAIIRVERVILIRGSILYACSYAVVSESRHWETLWSLCGVPTEVTDHGAVELQTHHACTLGTLGTYICTW